MSQTNPAFPNRKPILTADGLVDAGLASPQEAEALAPVMDRYVLSITPIMADLIRAGDKDDPIRRQFLPSPEELHDTRRDRPDPIGDDALSPLPGLVHRYPDRVLLKPLLVCPVYCRFCFRRERVGDADATLSNAEMDAAMDYVAARPEIREVILTGGDPLMLPTARISALGHRIAAIPHVEVIRWHSRVPTADPARITQAMAQALAEPFEAGKAVWLSVHVNHARELTPEARTALTRLRRAGIPLVSQTVLLKGVNDDPAVLEALFRALIGAGIKPYYLHHPDLAPGTAHFRLSIAEGQAIVRALRGRLSGIAQPLYVLDIPGGAGKVPLGPEYWDAQTGCVEDWQGLPHSYPE